MGQDVEFPIEGGAAGTGYLATPEHGSAGPALLVPCEGGGVRRGTAALCDRFAAEGFTALAVLWREPDGGRVPDGAVTQTAEGVSGIIGLDARPLPTPQLLGAVAFLEDHPLVHGQGVGVIGPGVAGIFAVALAAAAAEDVRALVVLDEPALGAGADRWWAEVTAPAECHIGTQGGGSLRELVDGFKARVEARRADVSVFRYPEVSSRFWDASSPSHDADADREAFVRTLSFLRAHLG